MKLEERSCKECGNKFKVLPQSKQEFCSIGCKSANTGEAPVFYRKRMSRNVK